MLEITLLMNKYNITIYLTQQGVLQCLVVEKVWYSPEYYY